MKKQTGLNQREIRRRAQKMFGKDVDVNDIFGIYDKMKTQMDGDFIHKVEKDMKKYENMTVKDVVGGLKGKMKELDEKMVDFKNDKKVPYSNIHYSNQEFEKKPKSNTAPKQKPSEEVKINIKAK